RPAGGRALRRPTPAAVCPGARRGGVRRTGLPAPAAGGRRLPRRVLRRPRPPGRPFGPPSVVWSPGRPRPPARGPRQVGPPRAAPPGPRRPGRAGPRRRKPEQRAPPMAPARPAPAPAWAALRPALHDEINRLPQRFRGPVVLCYLEGKSNEEAARLLGCPLG